MLITPEIAKQFLENGKSNNRAMRVNKIDQFARDMREGKWKRHTGETMKIGISGTLLDAHHRLRAIIKSGVSVWMEVAYNIPDENFDVLDTGSSRSAGDNFKILEIPNANITPSIIQQYVALVKGVVRGSGGSNKGKVLTNSDLIKTYYQNEDYWLNTTEQVLVWYSSFGRLLTPSVIGGFFSYFEGFDEEKAFSFFEQLCKPIQVDNDVILKLKNMLLNDRTGVKKITQLHKFGLILKSWNYYRSGAVCKILKFDPEKESLPIAK